MDIVQQYRPFPMMRRKGGGILFILGAVSMLIGLVLLSRLTGIFDINIPIDDKILYISAAAFSILGGLYMVYKALWKPGMYF